MGWFQDVKNALSIGPGAMGTKLAIGEGGSGTRPDLIAEPTSKAAVRNLSSIISPVQLSRIRQDVRSWREAMSEMELAWYPHRVRAQRMYIDTILNGHVFSLMERRKDLSMLRDYKVCDDSGKENEEWTQYFKKQPWFRDYLSYSLDAIFFGYSLISLGDVIDDAFPNISLVRRWNVSPDRLNVTRLVYSLSGVPFTEEPWADWHIWIDTPNTTGATNCGYGLFYTIGLYEILLRNTLGFNADFVELYAMPYRVGKTSKTEEHERAELEQALRDMGSAGYAIIDPMDEIAFLETKLGGTGWQSYDNLEQRCVKTITKIILGHEDAGSATPGKLGSGGDKEDNPITMAMMGKQTSDGKLLEANTTMQLFQKMRNLGFNMPLGLRFEFKNDEEKEAFRAKEDNSNLVTATIAKTMKDAGLQMDAKYYEERTGIKTTPVAEPEQITTAPVNEKDPATKEKAKNRLKELYGNV